MPALTLARSKELAGYYTESPSPTVVWTVAALEAIVSKLESNSIPG